MLTVFFSVTIPSDVNEPLGGILEVESPVSDGTIEENFEEELAQAPQVYTQVQKYTSHNFRTKQLTFVLCLRSEMNQILQPCLDCLV